MLTTTIIIISFMVYLPRVLLEATPEKRRRKTNKQKLQK